MPLKETAPEFLKSCLTNAFDVMGTGFMMRSKDYDAVGGIPAYPNLIFADMELWYRLTKISYKATSPKECFSFRIHQSTTTTTSDIKLQLAFEQVISLLKKLKDEGGEAMKVINENAITFIHYYCTSLSHRLLRTPQNLRNGVSVVTLIQKCKGYADKLISGNNYNPAHDAIVRMAKYIDSNFHYKKIIPAV